MRKPSVLIKEKQQRLNITYAELAKKINIPKQTLLSWKNDKSKPTKEQLQAILDLPVPIPFRNPIDAKYNLVDLFAGIGGIRLGFQQTGKTKTVFASEIDKFAKQTYFANFGDEPAGDITKIDAKNIPDHDILVGGFPCQPFSLAGKRLGLDDTRGTLFFEIARILQEKQPASFLLENVKGLKTNDSGRTFKIILKTLNDLNYDVHYTTLKARDFGVPQNRERLYIVGFNKSLVKNTCDFTFPVLPKTPTRLGNILDKHVDDKYTLTDHFWQWMQERKVKNKALGKGFGYSLFNENSVYANTISARYGKDGNEILIEQKNKNPRKLTPREAARLQGFPDKFVIPVSNTQAYKEFGNSVAVPVINAIADKITKFLDKNYKK